MDMVRKVIESTYEDTCSVTEQQKEKVKGVIQTKEVTVLENAPCRLSFEIIRAASETDSAAAVAQVVKLFIAPETEIKSGSKITVEHCGRTYIYTKSGIPAAYTTHQEIVLEPFKRYA